jgi:hypothetical protein
LSWLPAYLYKLDDIAPPFYRRWGELLDEVLTAEARAQGPAPDALPLHLRAAPGLGRPEGQGGADFLRALLAPARSGLILTRADFGRAARALGLGVRPGGRAFALESLLGQDAAGVLAWLGAEAEASADRHAARRPHLGATADWWERRARATADILKELGGDAAAAF